MSRSFWNFVKKLGFQYFSHFIFLSHKFSVFGKNSIITEKRKDIL